jgi:sulfite reductase alpha subunit-like flavoprotein
MWNNACILFGSQTGNSECIASDLFSRIEDEIVVNCAGQKKKKVTLSHLNDFASPDKWDVWKQPDNVVVIICSTTGNGDFPENADRFWRSVKKRNLQRDALSGVNYMVVGLGDTNYDKFCYAGKQIDQRLCELGANRVAPMVCADEATGLEEVIEPWLEDMVKLI